MLIGPIPNLIDTYTHTHSHTKEEKKKETRNHTHGMRAMCMELQSHHWSCEKGMQRPIDGITEVECGEDRFGASMSQPALLAGL